VWDDPAVVTVKFAVAKFFGISASFIFICGRFSPTITEPNASVVDDGDIGERFLK